MVRSGSPESVEPGSATRPAHGALPVDTGGDAPGDMRGDLRVSVVVPTLNEEAELPHLLTSLAGEGVAEVLVVDGGSADATEEVAREHGARWLVAQRGRGAQLAAGGEAATGDLLFFLHADARLAPGSVAAVRRAFADPEVVATGMRQRVDDPRRIFRGIERMADARVRRGWVYGDSGLAVRRSAYEAVGGFRPQPLFEDLDLSRRLQRRGRILLVEEGGIHVSARRWRVHGPVRQTIRNWLLTVGWASGMDPERLARYYRPHPSDSGRAAPRRPGPQGPP